MAEERDDNSITEEERQRAVDWFNKKSGGRAECPICRTRKWSIFAHFVTPTILGGKSRTEIMIAGTSYPHFMLSCDNCGNTQFINALKAGVLKPQKPEGTS